MKLVTALLLVALSSTAQAAETAPFDATSTSAIESAIRRSQVRALPVLPSTRGLRQEDVSDVSAGTGGTDWNTEYYRGRQGYILGNYVSLAGLIAGVVGYGIGFFLLGHIGVAAIIVGSTLAMAGVGRSRRAGEKLTGQDIDYTMATIGWVCYAAGWVTGVGFGLAHLFAYLQMDETDERIAGMSARGSNEGPKLVIRF